MDSAPRWRAVVIYFAPIREIWQEMLRLIREWDAQPHAARKASGQQAKHG